MKKIVKTFTFWFVLLGIAIVLFNLLNYDDMNIVMIGLKPYTKHIKWFITMLYYRWYSLFVAYPKFSDYDFIWCGIRFIKNCVKE